MFTKRRCLAPEKDRGGGGCTFSSRISSHAQRFCAPFSASRRHLDDLFVPQIRPTSIFSFRSCWVQFLISNGAHLLILPWFTLLHGCKKGWHRNCKRVGDDSSQTSSVQHDGLNYFQVHQVFSTSGWHCFLSHWGQVTHICVGNLTIIVSDNGLLPGRRQAII